MKLLKTTVVTILLLAFGLEEVDAQSFYQRRYKTLVLTAGTGTAHYFGDLVDDWYFTIDGNFTAGARYNLYDRITVGGDLTWFRLSAQDIKSEVKAPRNLSFFSNNYEFSGRAEVSLYPEPVRFYQREMFNPFLFGGVGLLYFNPKTKYEGETVALRPLQTEGIDYSSFTITFPFGVGLKYKLNAFMNITLEGGFRYTLTDYMDDVSSGVYPDPSTFDDELARELSDRSDEYGVDVPFAIEGRNVRGNPDKKDAYLLILGKIEYYLSPLRDSFRAIRYRGERRRRRR